MKEKKVIVIGGGLTGISAAVYLRLAGYAVELHEADSTLGGLAGSVAFSDGIRVPKFFTHWFESDTDLKDLFSILNLSDCIAEISAHIGVFFANDVFRFSRITDILSYHSLSLFSRLRCMYALEKLRRLKDWQLVEDVTAVAWLKKNVGSEALEKIWLPQLHGRFGAEAPNASAVWLWSRLQRSMKNPHQEVSGKMLTFAGGFHQALKKLEERLSALGIAVRLQSPVRKILFSSSNVEGILVADTLVKGDHVLSTVSIPLFGQLISDLPAGRISQWESVRYIGNRCLVMRLRTSLQKISYNVINDPAFPFVGVIEYPFPQELGLPQHESLVYMSRYLPGNDRLFCISDEEYTKYCLHYFKMLFPTFDESDIVTTLCWKYNYSQPVSVINYSTLIPNFQIGEYNLWCSTMAQIYPESRTKNNAIRYGKAVAERIVFSDSVS